MKIKYFNYALGIIMFLTLFLIYDYPLSEGPLKELIIGLVLGWGGSLLILLEAIRGENKQEKIKEVQSS